MADAGIDAVVVTLDVHAYYAVEGVFRRGFDVADLRDAGVVDKNVNTAVLREVVECGNDLSLFGDIAGVGGGRATCR